MFDVRGLRFGDSNGLAMQVRDLWSIGLLSFISVKKKTMPVHEVHSTDTKAGTIGGLLTAVLLRIGSNEVMNTILLSAVGAVVSYLVSLGMRWAFRKLRK